MFMEEDYSKEQVSLLTLKCLENVSDHEDYEERDSSSQGSRHERIGDIMP